jgi:hypothetical protein
LDSKNASFVVIFVIAEYSLKNSELIRCMMKMNAGLKKLAVMLTITAILLSFTQANMKMVSSSDTGRKIDVFTQKIPFNGKGINQSSDAFEPQELVILYANVTYNEAPMANKLVAFQVNNPANAFQNITVGGVSSTNQSGIAQFSFRIPWPSENAEQIIFGEWFAIATVDIAQQVVVDTLTFQVGWIIKITNITTLNARLEPQTRYLRGEVIVFDLTVENIALTLKSATIMIDVQDANSYPIIYVEMDNLVFQPGENHVRAYSQIPITATIGEAKVLAAVYTAPPKIGGVLFSPAALSQFEIISAPVPVEKHDIAITSVSASPLIAYVGTPVEITVEIVNLGNFTETFDVSICYDIFKIATRKVWSLDSGLNITMSFMWDTSSTSEGNYTIWALADFVPGEVNVANNVFVNGNVTLLSKHDIAVLNVSPSKILAYIGEIVYVYVVVKNEGNYIESFNATAFYDSNVVGTLFVNSLHPDDEKLLVFYWNTRNVTEGNYTLSAEANVVPGEANIDNNRFVDGVVWVKPWVFPPVWKIPIWLLALLFLLAMLIGILLLLVLICALLRRRRRKKKDKMVIPPIPPTIMPFQRSKKCRVCGKEFLGLYTFCPYCFTFHGKDYK